MYADMGVEKFQDPRNGREIPPRNLRCGGTCDTIGVNLFTTLHKEYGRRVFRRREASLGILFAAHFFRKIEISHTPHRNSKYNAGQEVRPGHPKSHDVRRWKISNFEMCKHKADSGHDRGKEILHCQSPSGAHGIKA